MPSPTLEFLDDFPADKEEEIRKLVQPMLRIVGRDLAVLRFLISSETDMAEINVMRRYHTASVWLSHAFFSQPETYKRKTLVHELVHVLVDILGKHGVQIIDAYFEDGSPEHDLLRVRFEESSEKLTDSLALAFLDILGELAGTQAIMLTGTGVRAPRDPGDGG